MRVSDLIFVLRLAICCSVALTDAALASSNSGAQRRTFGTRQKGTSRSQTAYARRKAGIKVKSKKGTSSKPPKWEKEGDALYKEIRNGGLNNDGASKNPMVMDMALAQEMLAKLAPSPQEETDNKSADTSSSGAAISESTDSFAPLDNSRTTGNNNNNKGNSKKKTSPSGTLWGTLPVGPILRTRLDEASLLHPTVIQTESFLPISRGKNAVIASPTGSGKSLAYLLPLLSTANRKTSCGVMVVTPTVELALQLQRQVVDKLWPPNNKQGGKSSSAMCVLVDHSEGQEEDYKLFSMVQDAPLIAGTPRTLRKLLAQGRVLATQRQSDNNASAHAVSRALQSNIKTIVLDEADRLLQTEGAARDMLQAKERKQQGGRRDKSPRRRNTAKNNNPTQTELLLSELPVSIQNLQLVCASATVGRTLRRQLMNLLGAPSMDKAAVLITADSRTVKNEARRKSSLLPDTLSHAYRLLPQTDNSNEGIVEDLWQTLQMLEPGLVLVFPGKTGVDTVQNELKARGLHNVQSLRDLQGGDASTSDVAFDTWRDTPVYVVGNKLGRGLDLPGVQYVILLSPPSSAAGYMHLSGRTGRNGNEGTAITLVRPREAPRLVAIATALGLRFKALTDTENESMDDNLNDPDFVRMKESTSLSNHLWSHLSDSALKRKTVSELSDYLVANNVPLPAASGKRPKKADLVSAIQAFHNLL